MGTGEVRRWVRCLTLRVTIGSRGGRGACGLEER